MTRVLVDSLAVGLYGRLVPPDLPVADGHDCFSMFVALGSTLGWLTDPRADGGGLWGMNDAEGPWFGDEPSGLRGTFQVSSPSTASRCTSPSGPPERPIDTS